jgi:hypothetical protein
MAFDIPWLVALVSLGSDTRSLLEETKHQTN